MEEAIRDFLEQFTVADLSARGVLLPDNAYTFLLKQGSVGPLLQLMREMNVQRLYHAPNGTTEWELTAEHTYINRRADSAEFRRGTLENLPNPGIIFDWQNRHINPFCRLTRPVKVFGRWIYPDEEGG